MNVYEQLIFLYFNYISMNHSLFFPLPFLYPVCLSISLSLPVCYAGLLARCSGPSWTPSISLPQGAMWSTVITTTARPPLPTTVSGQRTDNALLADTHTLWCRFAFFCIVQNMAAFALVHVYLWRFEYMMYIPIYEYFLFVRKFAHFYPGLESLCCFILLFFLPENALTFLPFVKVDQFIRLYFKPVCHRHVFIVNLSHGAFSLLSFLICHIWNNYLLLKGGRAHHRIFLALTDNAKYRASEHPNNTHTASKIHFHCIWPSK